MIKIHTWLGILILGILTCQVHAQRSECCNPGYIYKPVSKFHPPEFLDAGLFRKEIRSKLDLRSILDTLRKNSLVGFYMYTFSVDKSGKVRPFIYFNGKTDNLGEIQTYVASTFNYYKWKPGYRKKCMKCKAKLLMRLTISYEDDESRIEVYIEYLEDRYKKEIFSMNIPYSQLKTFK